MKLKNDRCRVGEYEQDRTTAHWLDSDLISIMHNYYILFFYMHNNSVVCPQLILWKWNYITNIHLLSSRDGIYSVWKQLIASLHLCPKVLLPSLGRQGFHMMSWWFFLLVPIQTKKQNTLDGGRIFKQNVNAIYLWPLIV